MTTSGAAGCDSGRQSGGFSASPICRHVKLRVLPATIWSEVSLARADERYSGDVVGNTHEGTSNDGWGMNAASVVMPAILTIARTMRAGFMLSQHLLDRP